MKPMATLLCFILAAPAIHAMDNTTGIQLTLARPQGDLKTIFDGKAALGFGMHSMEDRGDGAALVYRFDLTFFKRNEPDLDVRMNELRLGVDYQYFFAGRVEKGLYGIAGFGAGWGKLDLKYPGFRENQTKPSFSLGAGVGYLFTSKIGLEVKYTGMKYNFKMLAANGVAIIPAETNYSVPRVDITFLTRF